MKPVSLESYNPVFRITVKPPVKKFYAPNCWNEVSEGKYKDYSFTLYNNYEFGEKGSTLIVLRKAGTWVKSKLKYILGNQKKVLWSYREKK